MVGFKTLAASFVALSAVAFAATANGQGNAPQEKYGRLVKGLSDAGYTTAHVNAITLVVTTVVSVKVCPPEQDRDDGWVAFTINDVMRDFGRPREDLISRVQELVPALIEVLAADPAVKADFCGPVVPPENQKKR